MGVIFFFLPPPTASGQHREVHPYGPGPSGFETDLVVEINPSVLPDNPALAVMSGLIIVVPEPSPATTCTLVLRPKLLPSSDPLEAYGAIVYRNIDKASVGTSFSPRIAALGDKGFLQSMSLADRVAAFLAGSFPVYVNGGDDIGLPSTENGAGGWGRIGFEIVGVPAGLGMPGGLHAGSQEGWTRLLELIARGSLSRRIDPLAFFAKADATGILDAADKNHPLRTFLTRQILIEVRDEYDAPLVGDVDVLDGRTGTTTRRTIPAADRGTIVIEELVSGSSGTPSTGVFAVSFPSYVFSALPSSPVAEAAPNRLITGPDHWSLQRIFMDDVTTADNWFGRNDPFSRFTAGNKITPLIDGLETLGEYALAMRTVTSPGHKMYVGAYDLYDSFPLIPGDFSSAFRELTTRAATGGADVYAMAWDRPDPDTQNDAEVARVNALPGGHGHAILDNHTRLGGSQHQKFLVVDGNAGGYAFCGGVDIRQNRLDSPNHGAPSAFHDVHARVEGPTVADIHRTFVDRYNANPRRTGPMLPTTPTRFTANAGGMFVQLARTYPNGMNYPFAPHGTFSCLSAFLQAVGRAKKFIYAEDQFLFPYPDGTGPDSVGILDALVSALSRIDYLILVVSNHVAVVEGRSRRKDFITALKNAAPDKVHVFFLDRSGAKPARGRGEEATTWCDYIFSFTSGVVDYCSGDQSYKSEIYCHSKVWMVDDVCFKIGSANLNRRSMTHDAEMDLIVVDGGVENGMRAAALNFRQRLWGEHLGMRTRSFLLQDYKHALHYWLHPPPTAHIAPYDTSVADPVLLPPPPPTFNWDSTDPDGRSP